MKNIRVNKENGSFALDAPDYVNHYSLTANTAKAVTVPANATIAYFACTNPFYASYTGTAVVPGADVTNGTGNELNPTVRNVRGVTTVSVISAVDSKFTVAFYRE
jgi:hypothetical protein